MCPEIVSIIFSRNRAMQLELLLRNLNIPSSILYTYDEGFLLGYEKLMKMHLSFEFIKETNFKLQLVENIRNSKYVMFMVDDDVMLESFEENCPQFTEFKSNSDIISLSLNLCPRYRYRNLPTMDHNKWEWRPYSKRAKGYTLRIWGHPMTCTSHVFRTEDIIPIIESNDITNPNYLEHALVANEDNIKRSLMMCFDNPKTINNGVNQVQTSFPSRTLNISPEELEHKFLNGERLSLDYIKEKSKSARFYRMMIPYMYERS